MPKQLTFLQAADLHLGAPFRGLRALSEPWAKRLLQAIPEAYERVIETALRREVDFVVFAGDIFDTSRASYADHLLFFEGVRKLGRHGIPVYLCTGNHDPYLSWQNGFSALPENATMFSADRPSFALFEREGQPLCVLGGRGFFSQAWPQDACIAEGVTRAAAVRDLGERAARAPFGVGMLHTGLTFDLQKAPVDPAVLTRAGFDYWALGHIHKRLLIPEKNPQLAYSGCIQGRDINETGERGVLLVTLTEGAPNQVEFVPTASVAWEQLCVDVVACSNVTDVSETITRELFRANARARCEEMCVRVTLVGATPLHEVLARPGVLEDVRASLNSAYPEFFCDALVDATTQPIDKEALRCEGLFPAVLLQAAEALRANPGEMEAYVQDGFLQKNLQLPRKYAESLAELSEEAENLVLDLLGGGDA